jgi:subtilisin-like proprotein convertase family protein
MKRSRLITHLLVVMIVAFTSPCFAEAMSAASGRPMFLANTTVLVIRDNTTALPYPSSIEIAGLAGRVADVQVTLSGLTHTYPDDLDILLVGPEGQSALLMSDAGGPDDLAGVTLSFSTGAAELAPDSNPLVTGFYRPANWDDADSFAEPAPPGPWGTDLSVFQGTNPNGRWELYVVDDSGADQGSLEGGWSLTLVLETTPTDWRFFSRTGWVDGNRLALFLESVGEVFIDNVTVVNGTVPEAGFNWVVNGDCEEPFGRPWSATGTHASSRMTGEVSFAGRGSLHLIATGPGSEESAVIQTVAGLDPGGTYTLSFWYRVPAHGVPPNTLQVRLANTMAAAIPITPKPVLALESGERIVEIGSSLTLCAGTTGAGPLFHQWRLNDMNIPDATNECYSFSSIQPTNGGSYSVLAFNDSGSALSDPVVLIVNVPYFLFPADTLLDPTALLEAEGVLRSFNDLATRELVEPFHDNKPGYKSVWYRWIAPSSGIATFHTQGSSFDTLLAVYTRTDLSGLTRVASDDDQGGFYTSAVQFNARAGTDYLVAVDGLDHSAGHIMLNWALEETRDRLTTVQLEPEPTSVPPRGRAVFQAAADVLESTYQWFFNGEPIPRAQSSTLILDNVGMANVGFYSVRIQTWPSRPVETEPVMLQLGSCQKSQLKDKYPWPLGLHCANAFSLIESGFLADTNPPSQGFAIPIRPGDKGSQTGNITGGGGEKYTLCAEFMLNSHWLCFTNLGEGIMTISADENNPVKLVLAAFLRFNPDPGENREYGFTEMLTHCEASDFVSFKSGQPARLCYRAKHRAVYAIALSASGNLQSQPPKVVQLNYALKGMSDFFLRCEREKGPGGEIVKIFGTNDWPCLELQVADTFGPSTSWATITQFDCKQPCPPFTFLYTTNAPWQGRQFYRARLLPLFP